VQISHKTQIRPRPSSGGSENCERVEDNVGYQPRRYIAK